MRGFKVKGDFREGYIGFSPELLGEARFLLHPPTGRIE